MKTLHADTDELIALAKHGYPFNEYAASSLLGLNSCYSNTRYWMIRSAMGRHDARAVRVFLHDWINEDRKPKANVSKWIPGDHYHVLGVKFDTLDEACEHIRRRGYTYSGLTETHAYRTEGD